jgi:FdhD protein
MAEWKSYAESEPLKWRSGGFTRSRRDIAEEVPVAISYDGSTYAVMMATPADLEDFAIGFSLTEEVIDTPDDIESLEILEIGEGIEARMWLKPHMSQRQRARRRSIVGPTGCGLCGAESIAQALKPVRLVESRFTVRPGELFKAAGLLQAHQSLNARTHAVHAAALYAGGQLIVREDAGRHNALDKVIGGAIRQGNTVHKGIVILTSRVSVELVQKVAWLGAPIIAAISAPTALALRLANTAGITLIAVLRPDGFEVFTHPERVVEEASAHVA